MNLTDIFQQHQRNFQVSRYPEISIRKKRLLALKTLLQHNSEVLVKAVSSDFSHRSGDETLFLELLPSVKAINYCIKNVSTWSKARKRKVPWHMKLAKAYLQPQPRGVVGIMVPWNYPIYLLVVPLAYAVAAGNQVLIKCSELTPAVGATIQNLFNEVACLDEAITIINGDVECSKAFSALPFAHLLFTGSTAVGKEVMRAASQNLTSLTLELGGKSPVIVAPSAKRDYLNRLFMGKLYNAGQTCIAPDYLLVHKQWADEIEPLLSAFIEKHYPNSATNRDYSHIISLEHADRLVDLVCDAEAKGARVIQWGKSQELLQKFPITLLLNVNKSMRVMQEEIFGPIIPVITYTSFAEVLDVIDTFSSPLALYYFGSDKLEITHLQFQTLSGALVINDTLMHIAIDDLPFGGVGDSGMGCYHGQEGFDTFSQIKPVFKQKSLAPISWFYPPYGKLIQFFIRHYAGIQTKERQ